MAHKKPMKLSEARIIVYLNQASKMLHYVRQISSKLQMDYGYCIKILMSMKDKDWITRNKSPNNPSRTYYHLSVKGMEQLTLAINTAADMIKEDDANGN